MKTFYLIVGPMVNDSPSYWNVDSNNWIIDAEKASTFPIEILSLPLPYGTEGIMEVTYELEPVGFYKTLPPLEGAKIYG